MAIIVKADQVSTELVGLAEQAQEYISKSRATNTLAAYQSDWADFTTWCTARQLESLPASGETVACYLTALVESGRKVSTLQRRLASISVAHQVANQPNPTQDQKVKSVMRGIRRDHGTAQKGKAPVWTQEIRGMIANLPDSLLGIRDRALLLVGFAGAFRRSELVALTMADLEFTRDGLVVMLQRSKTDQEGIGRKVAIPYGSNPDTCPVRSLQEWLAAAGIQEGPVFRSVNRHGHLQPGGLSDKAVALVVKRAAESVGLNPSQYAGHSLRAGMATSAAANGASERSIMKQTGHKSENMVRRYIRDGNMFRENAAAQLGL